MNSKDFTEINTYKNIEKNKEIKYRKERVNIRSKFLKIKKNCRLGTRDFLTFLFNEDFVS